MSSSASFFSSPILPTVMSLLTPTLQLEKHYLVSSPIPFRISFFLSFVCLFNFKTKHSYNNTYNIHTTKYTLFIQLCILTTLPAILVGSFIAVWAWLYHWVGCGAETFCFSSSSPAQILKKFRLRLRLKLVGTC
jgi:hypothetical protein